MVKMDVKMQSATTDIEMKIELTLALNYALQQNRLPVIGEFIIANHSTEDLENVTVRLHCEPEILHTAQTTCARDRTG